VEVEEQFAAWAEDIQQELVRESHDGGFGLGILDVGAVKGTEMAVWRAGSAGMQDRANHERARGWQLSTAMAAWLTQGQASRGRVRGQAGHAWEGAVRGARAGGAVRGVGEEQFGAWRVGCGEEDARGGGQHGWGRGEACGRPPSTLND
jgi:hypothetical protein